MEFQLKAVCCIVKITKILSKLEMVDAGVRLTSYFQRDFVKVIHMMFVEIALYNFPP